MFGLNSVDVVVVRALGSDLEVTGLFRNRCLFQGGEDVTGRCLLSSG
jgi:hypothetical protein